MRIRRSCWRAAVWLFIWMLGGGPVVLVSWSQTAAATLPTGSSIEYDPDAQALTVHASGVSLPHLLDAVTKETGVAFQLPADQKLGNRPVTMAFDKMPLERAIKQLLRQTNYAMVYRTREDKVAVLDHIQVISLSEGLAGSPESAAVGISSSPPLATQPPTTYTPEELQARREARQQRMEEQAQERAEKEATVKTNRSSRSRGRQPIPPPAAPTPEAVEPSGGTTPETAPAPGKK